MYLDILFQKADSMHRAKIMKGLVRPHARCMIRAYCTKVEQLKCSRLQSRGLIQVYGPDASDFLQGLITNDMQCINMRCGVPSMFSMLLNTKGRILNDLILYHCRSSPSGLPDTYLIECDRQLQEDFTKNISRYKIRRKVTIDVVTEALSVWAVFPDELSERSRSIEVCYNEASKKHIVVESHDPRCKAFGRRMILPDHVTGRCIILLLYVGKDDTEAHFTYHEILSN